MIFQITNHRLLPNRFEISRFYLRFKSKVSEFQAIFIVSRDHLHRFQPNFSDLSRILFSFPSSVASLFIGRSILFIGISIYRYSDEGRGSPTRYISIYWILIYTRNSIYANTRKILTLRETSRYLFLRYKCREHFAECSSSVPLSRLLVIMVYNNKRDA